MKSIIMSLMLMWTSAVYASGSDTVFIAKIEQFRVIEDLSKIRNPQLNAIIHGSEKEVLLVQVNRKNLASIKDALLEGVDVYIEFGSHEPIRFSIDNVLGLITGETDSGITLLLWPCNKG
jgi:hypothetical protein